MVFRKGALEKVVMTPRPQFWAGKRVLLTGHTGFKGGWTAIWLSKLGAQVTGVALAPDTDPSLYDLAGIAGLCDSRICDIRDLDALSVIIREAKPEIVLHLAAQPLVRASYARPIDTFASNVMGTANILDAIRREADPRVALMITTDKVYHNREWCHPYRESDRLGGHDPYSASKAAAEIVVSSYRDSFLRGQGVRVATARAGNVIGGGDWSEDRLIPDAVRAWTAGGTLSIRRPDATRPWQHVLEPVSAYLVLAEAMWARDDLPDSFNFGPEASNVVPVKTVIETARSVFGDAQVSYGEVPEGLHEAQLLALDVSLARSVLGVQPKWGLEETVARTMRWYKDQNSGRAALDLCHADIQDYEQNS